MQDVTVERPNLRERYGNSSGMDPNFISGRSEKLEQGYSSEAVTCDDFVEENCHDMEDLLTAFKRKPNSFSEYLGQSLDGGVPPPLPTKPRPPPPRLRSPSDMSKAAMVSSARIVKGLTSENPVKIGRAHV